MQHYSMESPLFCNSHKNVEFIVDSEIDENRCKQTLASLHVFVSTGSRSLQLC